MLFNNENEPDLGDERQSHDDSYSSSYAYTQSVAEPYYFFIPVAYLKMSEDDLITLFKNYKKTHDDAIIESDRLAKIAKLESELNRLKGN